MPQTREQSWFVRATFGAEFGPLDSETLLAMANSGELSPQDSARSENESDWQPLAPVLESLREIGRVKPAHSDFRRERVASLVSAPAVQHSAVRFDPPVRTMMSEALEAIEANEELPESITLEQTAEPEGVDVAFDQSTIEEFEAEDDSPEFESLNSWRRQRRSLLKRLNGVAASHAAEESRKAHQTSAESSTSANAESDGTATPDSKTSPKRPQVESFDERMARWTRSLPSLGSLMIVALIVAAAVWFWPKWHSNRSIANRYHAIYDELRHRRDLPQDKTGMTEFVERIQPELDLFIQSLEKAATSDDQDSTQLLWIGRDCLRPMLKAPKARNTKHEAHLKKLLANWDQAHGIVNSPETSTTSAASTNEPWPTNKSKAVEIQGFDEPVTSPQKQESPQKPYKQSAEEPEDP